MDLHSPVSELPMVGPQYEAKLAKLGINFIEDLFMHVPNRYKDFRITSPIAHSQIGEVVTVKAEIISMKNIFSKTGKRLQIAEIADDTGKMQVIWFNQIFLVRTIKPGMHFSFSGKVSFYNRKKAFIAPEYENLDNPNAGTHTGRLVPVYPETAGLSSKWLRQKINYTFQNFKEYLDEFLPENEIKDLNYLDYLTAVESVHFPAELDEVEKGKERLAFNELLFQQLKSLKRKSEWINTKVSKTLKLNTNLLEEFKKNLSFELTASQERSIREILTDLEKVRPMNRLLEGDVGSGKTIVAAAGSFAAFVNGYQSVIMAPTQLLAEQHYKTLSTLFEKFKIRVSLLTANENKSALGTTDIFVGTHSLIHKKARFDTAGGYTKVALVVIDEQHRFGVEQRQHLIKKSGRGKSVPHILTMTATPIPRTIALTAYGDMDLSTLDELPKNRMPITTWLVPPEKRVAAYRWIEEQITKNRIQVFIVCPLIEESQVESMKQVKAVKLEFENIKKQFPKRKVLLLHGKQKAKEKNEILDKFKSGKAEILVSTPVIEVGIDVPNAGVMLIEGSERFGLSQLHQLRGRIGRGDKKSYCLLFTESNSEKVTKRLSAMTKAMSGFELAEYDLQMRGPGDIYGVKQHGFPELKIAKWHDTELIKKARSIAEKVIKSPDSYPLLIKKIIPNKSLKN